ncbi:MAG: hypothetical protein ACREIT_03245, partial [Tepidisphaeraceae bacterium]
RPYQLRWSFPRRLNIELQGRSMTHPMRSIVIAIACVALITHAGCAKKPKPYGVERPLALAGATRQQVWAVAPAVNLSGQQVDALLQADLLYGQAQQVRGVTVVPVNRVVEVYEALGIETVQSEEQASLVCDLLGCDGLLVPTITVYDPYNPPKLGASLQLFLKPATYARPATVDPRELARQAAPPPDAPLPHGPTGFVQSVGMFDAANGSVRDRLMLYAQGRNDPQGPLKTKEYLISMDRYVGFVYHELIEDLVGARLKGI